MKKHPAFAKRGAVAFTLVELMVVMGIIVILMSLLAPAFIGIGKGSSLKAAGNNISYLAMVGRQNSLAKNAMTALVIIGNSGTGGDYRAYGLFEIEPRGDGTSPLSTDWSQIGKWEQLPDGVAMDTCSFDAQSVAITPALPPLYYEGALVSQYQYAVFLSNGSLLSSTISQLRLVPGFRPSGSQNVVYTEKMIAGSPADYYSITILNANGRVKIEQP